jgi:hypothetical protein
MGKIVKFDPKDWQKKKATLVQIDIEAKDNWEAIEALESWASDHGFARANENFLRIIMRPDGSKVFRGICYRLTAEEKTSIKLNFNAVVQRAKRIGGMAKSVN